MTCNRTHRRSKHHSISIQCYFSKELRSETYRTVMSASSLVGVQVIHVRYIVAKKCALPTIEAFLRQDQTIRVPVTSQAASHLVPSIFFLPAEMLVDPIGLTRCIAFENDFGYPGVRRRRIARGKRLIPKPLHEFGEQLRLVDMLGCDVSSQSSPNRCENRV